MKKLLKQTLKELMVIYFASFLCLGLVNLIIEIGAESNMKGWVETYFTMIIFSTVAIFIIDKDISIRSKILGSFIVAFISIGLIYLWSEHGPRNLVLFGLIFGFPFLLIASKHIYKKLTTINLSPKLDNEQRRQEHSR